MATNFLCIPSGYLHGYATFSDFVSGDILPQTTLFVGAMGRTDDALKVVAQNFVAKHTDDALRLFEQVKQQHITLAKYLLVVQYLPVIQQMQDIFTEVEWLLHDEPVRHDAYYADQICCAGPLLNSILLSAVCTENKKANGWLDARDILRTDNHFGDAELLAELTNMADLDIHQKLHSLLILPWGVGSTTDNESTRYQPGKLTDLLRQQWPDSKMQVLGQEG